MVSTADVSERGALGDLKRALERAQRAAEAGNRAAQNELAALVGNWRMVTDLAAGKKQREDTWGRLREAVNIERWLSVPHPVMLSDSPRIGTAKAYLSPQICDWLIRLGRPHLDQAQIQDPQTGELRYVTGRTNRAAVLSPERGDLVLAFVRARIAALADLPVQALEPTQVLHYEVGQEFAAHQDYLDVSFPGYAADVEKHGQRVMTVLVYLNDDFEGGHTAFPLLDLRYKGRKGDAIAFWNLADDGTPQPRTLHIGTAPTRGEKWLLSQWIRIRVAPRAR